jgi:hypothetical protein
MQPAKYYPQSILFNWCSHYGFEKSAKIWLRRTSMCDFVSTRCMHVRRIQESIGLVVNARCVCHIFRYKVFSVKDLLVVQKIIWITWSIPCKTRQLGFTIILLVIYYNTCPFAHHCIFIVISVNDLLQYIYAFWRITLHLITTIPSYLNYRTYFNLILSSYYSNIFLGLSLMLNCRNRWRWAIRIRNYFILHSIHKI